MIKITEVSKLADEKLKAVHTTLVSMSNRRLAAASKIQKRHKKLKLNFKQSENSHFNNLLDAVKSELVKRKI